MTPNRPYLIRALYDWIVDNSLTPYLLVDATQEGVEVPGDFVEDGRIVLNVAPGAVKDLLLGNEGILFNARFSGRPVNLSFPTSAVLGIYARENGQGMLFADADSDELPPDSDPDTPPEKPGRPSLKVVK